MACYADAASSPPMGWDRYLPGAVSIPLVETHRRGGSNQHLAARRSSVWCAQAR